MDQPALIAIGANLTGPAGAPAATLRAALAALGSAPGLTPRAVSRFWQSPAYPPGAGPDYINAAATFDCALDAPGLLALLHRIESDHGRTRETRWGARVLDLDLIALGQAVAPDRLTWRQWQELDPARQRVSTPDRLILPHPRLQDRAFVLVPLVEIAPDWRHPILNRTIRQMHDALPPADIAALTPAPESDRPDHG